MAKFPAIFLNWLLFILLSLIWGSSFILMKKGLVELNAWQVASIRIISAGLFLMPVAVRQILRVNRKDLLLVILAGAMGTFFPAYLFCLAETRLDSALAGILNALTPLCTIVIGALFFHAKLPINKWIGVVVGMIGLVMLISVGRDIQLKNIAYSGLIILATIFYGFNVNLVSHRLRHISSLHLAALSFSLLAIPAAVVLDFSSSTSDIFPHLLNSSVVASAVLGIFGTAIASILFYMLLKRAGALFASMVTYGIPFVALFWGILSGEMINAIQVGCLGLILFGVYLTNRK